MKKTQKQLKLEFLAEAEIIFDELMVWEENTTEPNLSQIEEIVLKLRKRLGEDLAMAVIERQEKREPTERPKCVECGVEMENKGKKHNQVESLAGELKLERGYYHCKKCKQGYFPPG